MEQETAMISSAVIRNRVKNRYHYTNCSVLAPIEAQVTKCGWPFAKLPHDRVSKVPDDAQCKHICKTCFPALHLERATAMQEVEVSDSESSSNSSSSSA